MVCLFFIKIKVNIAYDGVIPNTYPHTSHLSFIEWKMFHGFLIYVVYMVCKQNISCILYIPYFKKYGQKKYHENIYLPLCMVYNSNSN